MSFGNLDTDSVARLLLRDAVPSLGERARAEVRRLLRNYEELAREWRSAGASPAEVQRSFDRAVVDGLQEAAHDLPWDTTWPACPRHARHPLWYDEAQRAWCCQQDGIALAPLGALSTLQRPVT